MIILSAPVKQEVASITTSYKNSFLEPPLLSELDVIDPEPEPEPVSELVGAIDAAADEEEE